MIDELLSFDKWHAPATQDTMKASADPSMARGEFKKAVWRNFKGELSPIDIYKYLRARFGLPNGIAMIGKQRTLTNLIHWHYTIFCGSYRVDLYGHSSGIEIMARSNVHDITDQDRPKFISALKADFKNHGKAIGMVEKGFESWTLFINPYVRISQTIDALFDDLLKIELKESVAPPVLSPKSVHAEYMEQSSVWAKDIAKAAAIGTTIRMLLPVVAESFVNLVIYIFKKKEYSEDERLYNTLIRGEIDSRVKLMHNNCDGFAIPINSKDPRFIAFHTLMNKRNDFLHGNINPSMLKLETLFVDEKYTPLFKEDESIFKKMMAKYPADVSIDQVRNDLATVQEFIELVLESLDKPSRQRIEALLSERFPGINQQTKEIASLIPHYAEGLLIIEPTVRENHDYQLFMEGTGLFAIYIPSDWFCDARGEMYYFMPVKSEKDEQIILSIKECDHNDQDLFKRFKSKKLGNHDFHLMPAMKLKNTINASYFTLIQNKLVHFTYTKAFEDGGNYVELEPNSEYIIGSFGFIEQGSRKSLLEKYHFENFVKGLAATAQLIHNSITNKAFFEAATLLLTTIEAKIRLILVYKKALIENLSELDVSLLFQDKNAETKDFKELIKEVTDSDMILKEQSEALFSVAEHRKILENFIITSTALWEVEDYAQRLYHLDDGMHMVIEDLERKLVESGLTVFASPVDKEFYRYYVKSKIGDNKIQPD